jgi:hypothetical protein
MTHGDSPWGVVEVCPLKRGHGHYASQRSLIPIKLKLINHLFLFIYDTARLPGNPDGRRGYGLPRERQEANAAQRKLRQLLALKCCEC